MKDLLEFAINSLLCCHYQHILYIDVTNNKVESIWTTINSETFAGSADAFFQQVTSDENLDLSSVEVKNYTDTDLCYETLCKTPSISFKYRKKIADEWRWKELEIHTGPDFSRAHVSFLLYIKDISTCYLNDLQKLKTMKADSTTDTLTGLRNRRAFDKDRCNLSCSVLGVVYMDLNCLKAINDREGHLHGDKYIQEFCSCILDLFPPKHCYRIGGDEFVVLLPDVNEELFYTSIKQLIAMNEYRSGVPFAAIGYELGNLDRISFDEIYSNAESLMYAHKRMLKKRFQFDR